MKSAGARTLRELFAEGILKVKMAIYHATKFGDKITADRKILNEEGESRLQHRYVVAQDFAAQWLQSYPCQKPNFTRYREKFTEVS